MSLAGIIRGLGIALPLTLLVSASVADVRTTPHGLVKSGAKGMLADEREVCIYCHTPTISGDGRVPERPPHWQRSVGRDYMFTIYDDIGRLGFDKPSIGSQSIACLSCHDSNQALSVSKTSADHPFGVPYRGAIKERARQPRPTAQGTGDTPDTPPHRHAQRLVALEDFRDASRGVVENRPVWWVSSAGITARRSRNDLPLYARIDHETGEELPHIECSSCHDPHSPNELFLRVSNAGSVLCLTCHNK